MRKQLPFFILILGTNALILSYLILNLGLINSKVSAKTAVTNTLQTATKPLLSQIQSYTTPALAYARAVQTELGNIAKVCIGGDVNLAEVMATFIADGMQPFAGVQPLLNTCDLHILNLETNVAHPATGIRQNKNYAFKAPPATLSTLIDARVAGVSLANNHTMDFGPDALLEQIQLLQAKNISSFGAGSTIAEAFAPAYFNINGNKLAFIGINDAETGVSRVRPGRAGSAYLDRNQIQASLTAAKANNALAVIMPHWGTEHQLIATSKQVQWAQTFVDLGADLVVGAHPHVRQNISQYKGKQIFYSLGNYMFAGFADRAEAQKSMLLEVYVYKNQIQKINVVQLQLNWFGFPSPIN